MTISLLKRQICVCVRACMVCVLRGPAKDSTFDSTLSRSKDGHVIVKPCISLLREPTGMLKLGWVESYFELLSKRLWAFGTIHSKTGGKRRTNQEVDLWIVSNQICSCSVWSLGQRLNGLLTPFYTPSIHIKVISAWTGFFTGWTINQPADVNDSYWLMSMFANLI